MKSIVRERKNINVVGDYDVIVIGGGTAGAIAAISAALEGARTLIIEQLSSLGGSQTNGLVTPIMPSGVPGNTEYCSINLSINARMMKYGFSACIENLDKTKTPRCNEWFDPLMMKIALEEVAVEAGCHILYYTTVTDVIKQKNSISHVIVSNKEGTTAYSGKCFIDCTGDGDVAFYSGCCFEFGNNRNVNQAASLRFQMTNIDLDQFGAYLEEIGQNKTTRYPFLHTAAVNYDGWPLYRLFVEKYHEGMLTDTEMTYFQAFSIPGKPKDLAFNCPQLGQESNVIQAAQMTKMNIAGKKSIMVLANFLKQCVPGFTEAYVCDIASMLGVRESRRIKTVYFMTKDDIFSYRKFPDGIVKSNYPIDIHGSDELEENKYRETHENDKYYEIPFRSLVPVDIANLLVAGRCMGADYFAQSSTRVQHTCRAMGEAAGIAAAVCAADTCNFHTFEGSIVRKKMSNRGVSI